MTISFLVAFLARTLIVGGQDSDVVSFAGVVVAYSLGAHMPGRESLVAVAVLLVGYLVDQLLISGFSAGLVPGAALLLGFPWLAGRALSSHRQLTRELGARTAQLEHEREERARLAVVQERGRIAVQINTVVARAIAAMVGHAEAGRAALAGERSAVERALRQVERGGRDALAEMRRLLGALRTMTVADWRRSRRSARSAVWRRMLGPQGWTYPCPWRGSLAACPPASTSPLTGSFRRRCTTLGSSVRARSASPSATESTICDSR
jgi:signal transduction histidine kinase